MASEDVPFQCQKCGIESSPTQRILVCTRCFSVGYCSKSCQKADWRGHKPQCRPTTKPTATVVVDSPSPAQEDDTVVRLEVKRGEIDSEGNAVWDDVGPINLLEDNMANATVHHSNKKMGDSNNRRTATLPVPKNASTKPPNLSKELPITTQRILGPESSYKYRHSSDGVDENLLIFFHGAGDSNLPYDALGKRMELPQTATLSLSASTSLHLRSEKESKESSKFVELPFGLGFTWFEEMDYSSGETLPRDHPSRLKSLKHAVGLLDSLLGSLTGIGSGDGDAHDSTTWIPERIFLFGFSAGACLVHELCRMWWNAGRMALGGVICIGGGIQTKKGLPGMKPKGVTQQKQPTDVLIITGSKDSTYTKEAAQLSKQFYHPSKVQVHVQKGKGHSMIESKDEMQMIMEFLSKRLVRRMVSMEGQCR